MPVRVARCRWESCTPIAQGFQGKVPSALGKSDLRRGQGAADGRQVDIPVIPHRERRSDEYGQATRPLNGLRSKRRSRRGGKSLRHKAEARRGAKGRPSSEAADSGFREKLLAIMPMRPVPKPTQVGKARSLR